MDSMQVILQIGHNKSPNVAVVGKAVFLLLDYGKKTQQRGMAFQSIDVKKYAHA